MNSKTILFVDDEATILKSFCVALKHLGYLPSGASSGEDAITMLRQHAYEVVVTDLKMPGIGIPSKNLTKVLDPYFSTKGKGSTKGMGLGLTLANTFIEQNKGHLHITSAHGRGTTVTLYLPSCPTNQSD